MPLLLSLLFSAPAEAGCATDPDRLLRWSLAPLIAEGTITSLEVVDGEVFERVTIERVHRGAVEGPSLRLRGELPRTGCPGSSLFPVGAAVYIVGALDEDGAIAISPCTADVGLRHALTDDLAAIAAEHPEAGRTFPGAALPAPPSAATLDGAPGDHVRAQLGSTRFDGQILGDSASDPLTVQVGVGDMDVAASVEEADLVTVISADWAVSGSALRVRAGTGLDDDGYVVLDEGWAIPSLPPEAVVGTRWQPTPKARWPSVEEHTLQPGSWRLLDGPEGMMVATLRQDRISQVWVTEAEDDWRALWVDTDALSGTVWIEAAALWADDGGIVGGSVGGVLGSSAPILLDVPAGTEVRRPGGGVFARARHLTSLQWLVTGDEQALVVVDGPAGPEIGAVRCVRDEGETVGCRVPRD